MILCYPVITSGDYAHKESFENLLGDDSTNELLREKLSIEKQVNEDTPKAFLWHTFTDELVPVENSFLLVAALRKETYFNRIFICIRWEGTDWLLQRGKTADPDGLGEEPQCASWMDLVKNWLEAVTR